MAEALEAIVDGLIGDGHIIGLDLAAGKVLDAASSPTKASPPPKKQRGRKGNALPKPKAKKPMDGYVCANRYTLGEAFKVRNARLAAASGNDAEDTAAEDKGEEEEEEELNEYERERQENILRNQAFLASLGLA